MRRAVRSGEDGGEVCVEIVLVETAWRVADIGTAVEAGTGGDSIGEVEREENCMDKVGGAGTMTSVGLVSRAEKCIESVGGGSGAATSALGTAMGEIGAVSMVMLDM